MRTSLEQSLRAIGAYLSGATALCTVLVLCTGLFTGQWAQGAVLDPTCPHDRQDPFDFGARLTEGQDAGKCFDSQRSRPLTLLPEASRPDASLEQSWASQGIWVANIHHFNRYFVGYIPSAQVEQALMQIEEFPADVPAAHTQLRMIFSSEHPVRLYEQKTWQPQRAEFTPDFELCDLALSVEAGGPKHFDYNIYRGTMNDFVLVLRAKTLWETADWMVVQANHKVKQVKLNLNPDQLTTIIDDFAEKSTNMGVKHTYHTLYKNCSNELLKFIDQVSESRSWMDWFGREINLFVKAQDAYPVFMEEALRRRGVHAGYIWDLGEEWPHHPESQLQFFR